MDTIDFQIIKQLQKDGRISNKKLAEIISLSPPAVAERVKRLEEKGVITGYKAVVDPQKLDKNIMAIINLILRGDLDKLVKFAKEEKSIVDCYFVTGGVSVIFKAFFKDMTELDSLIEALQKYGSTHTYVVIQAPFVQKPFD